ncbi:hybrid sensor histidine kinase/response regulator [Emcibacter sp. SYSU 3D8]|uniref:hybrid sensor histidine kinase/response regulator n=1 Tax=Emcibacter sp. SYSU 3D8 TaxID=3133969 RepID=UPI0031FE622B
MSIEVDTELLDMFRAEVEEQIAVLQDAIVALDAGGDAAQHLGTCMRAAHSLKGAARIVGIDPGVQIAHAMEDAFEGARKGHLVLNADHIDRLLAAGDYLAHLGKIDIAALPAWLDAEGDAIAALVGELEAIGGTGDAAPEPVPQPRPQPPPQPVEEPASAPAIQVDVELLEMFRAEVEEQIAVLQDSVVALDAGGDTAQHLTSCMRAAHSLKGAARIVGIDHGVRLAHAMEDAFEGARQNRLVLDGDHIDRLLAAGDYIAHLGKIDLAALPAWLITEGDAIAALIGELEMLGKGGQPAPASAQPETPQPTATAEPAPIQPAVPLQTDTRPVADASNAEARAMQSVKVSTETLAKFMGVSAQVLIDAKRLQSTVDSLQQVRRRLAGLERALGSDSGTGINRTSASDLVRQELAALRDDFAERIDEFETQTGRSLVNADLLYGEVLRSRMRPFSDVVGGFPRLVRDVARQLDKKATLEIVGRNTEMDRDIAGALDAPLGHLLRNAVDHGLEMPDIRRAAGKSEEGTIFLEARHRGGALVVTVRDDGRGIDVERLRVKIVEKGLVDAETSRTLSDAETLEFLFLPGFSTAAQVTDVSGRGVGLDVVQSTVQRAGGMVHVTSVLGQGTTFELQMPVARSVVRALLVTIGGAPWALPLARIDEIREVDAAGVRMIEGRRVIDVEGADVGVVSLAEVLELDAADTRLDTMTLVMIREQGQRFGLEVEGVVGEQELVVRPLDPRLGKVPDVLASSLLDNGTAVLILDLEDLVRSVDSLLAQGRLRGSRRSLADATRRARHILVVDDSLTVRETERKLLERAGYLVDVAVDGVAGWNTLRLGNYDLLLTDVDMPRMTGIDLTRAVRDDARLRDLPVMIVSYKEREEDRRAGFEAGADRYITKASFRDDSLLKAVEELIGGPWAE